MNWYKFAANIPTVKNYDWDANHRDWLWIDIGGREYFYQGIDYSTYEILKRLREDYFNGPKRNKRNILGRLFGIVKQIESKMVKFD